MSQLVPFLYNRILIKIQHLENLVINIGKYSLPHLRKEHYRDHTLPKVEVTCEDASYGLAKEVLHREGSVMGSTYGENNQTQYLISE